MATKKLVDVVDGCSNRFNLIGRASGIALGLGVALLGQRASQVSAYYPVSCCHLEYPTQCGSTSGADYSWACCSSDHYVTMCYEDHTAQCSLADQQGATC